MLCENNIYLSLSLSLSCYYDTHTCIGNNCKGKIFNAYLLYLLRDPCHFPQPQLVYFLRGDVEGEVPTKGSSVVRRPIGQRGQPDARPGVL